MRAGAQRCGLEDAGWNAAERMANAQVRAGAQQARCRKGEA